jgi:Tfp pilus assembly protein PilF
MKNASNKTIWIILPVVLFFLFSCASTQQRQSGQMGTKLYLDQAVAHLEKGEFGQAISDLDKAIDTNPRDDAYYNRGVAYYSKQEYGKSWDDIKKAQDLGYKIPPEFLEGLRKASGRQN